MRYKLINRWFYRISNRSRFFSFGLLLCLSVAFGIMHVSSSKSYSSPALLGLASGLGTVAAWGLIYSLARFRR